MPNIGQRLTTGQIPPLQPEPPSNHCYLPNTPAGGFPAHKPRPDARPPKR